MFEWNERNTKQNNEDKHLEKINEFQWRCQKLWQHFVKTAAKTSKKLWKMWKVSVKLRSKKNFSCWTSQSWTGSQEMAAGKKVWETASQGKGFQCLLSCLMTSAMQCNIISDIIWLSVQGWIKSRLSGVFISISISIRNIPQVPKLSVTSKKSETIQVMKLSGVKTPNHRLFIHP